ncbi:MAG TPA: S8 family peptidase [Blastocatellia bacterium]|nr:S8 family peptidase [Blastocatellia bacterium]
MKKFLVVCLCLVISSFAFTPHGNVYSRPREQPRPLYVEDEILIKVKDDAAQFELPEQIAEEILPARGAQVEPITKRQQILPGLIRFKLNGQMTVEEAVQRAKADPRVEYAEPDYLLYANDTQPNDPYFKDMWGLSSVGCLLCQNNQTNPNINATRAWDITTGSSDVVVAVLDTGVDVAHEDLAANIWTNPNEIAGNGLDDDGDGFIDDVNGWNFYDDDKGVFKKASDDSHGTHVAGIIGAEGNNGIGVTGVAWHVRLMSLKFLGGSKGSGSTADAVAGINYAIEQRKRGVNVRVINASWGGGGYSQSLRDAIAAAGQAGILFVCAAGNDGEDVDQTPDYPAAYSKELSNTISVAAIDANDAIASFSNYGHGTVSVAAPGQSIISTLPGNSYGNFSGTSMATPFVSGVAALLWSREPQLTPAEVKQRIVSTAEPTIALASRILSSGRVNAYNALTNAAPQPHRPEIASVSITKKDVTIDGLGFINGSAIIEVNGVPLSSISYDDSYALANGTLTRLSVYLGKKTIRRMFPKGEQETFTIYNPTTGERSAQFKWARY